MKNKIIYAAGYSADDIYLCLMCGKENHDSDLVPGPEYLNDNGEKEKKRLCPACGYHSFMWYTKESYQRYKEFLEKELAKSFTMPSL